MKKIVRTNRFKKDVKKMKKREKSFDVFKQLIQKLAKDELLFIRTGTHSDLFG